MKKRAQVTLFIILGIVLLVAIVFFIFVRTKVITPAIPKIIMPRVEEYVDNCIKEAGQQGLNLVGKQGGDVNPGLYTWYKRDKVTYLCYTENYTACVNRRPGLKYHVEREISSFVKSQLTSCMNNAPFERQGYAISQGEINVETIIGDYNTRVDVDFPITIQKGDFVFKKDKFSAVFDVPLGELVETASKIVNEEISNPLGVVFWDLYIAKSRGRIEIEKDTIEKAEIYILKTRDNTYTFKFAVQGWVRS